MKQQAKKKIAFISTDWNDNPYRKDNNKYGGISYYRLVKPMELLKEEYDVTFYGADIQKKSDGLSHDEFYNWLTREYDMIIVKQIDNATAAQALVHWCSNNECILVQDFDDNMMAVREDQPAHKMGYNVGGQRRAYAASMMSLADALIVSTKPLQKAFKTFLERVFNEDKDIYIFPNYNDINDWNTIPQPEKDPSKVVIGWAGSVTHDSDLMVVMPTLGKILDKYDNVYLELLGGILQGSFAFLLNGWTAKAKAKVKVIYGTPAWDKYPEKMRTQSWDIAIAPLIDDEFNQSKSHIKWMEYTMCGWPTIASNVYPYVADIGDKKVIQHGVTGLVASKKEWKDQLVRLIKNADERKAIADNAYQYITENLQWDQHGKEYLNIVSSIFEKSDKRKAL